MASEDKLTWEDGSPNWSMNSSFANPFGNGSGCDFSTAVADGEFCSIDAAATILEEDLHINDDLKVDQSVRLDTETYMNMTIGTYMATRSEDLGQNIADISNPSTLSPPMRKRQELPWLRMSTEESLPHTLPQFLENSMPCVSPPSEETLPHSPPVPLISLTGYELSSSPPAVDMEKTSGDSSHLTDYTLSEIHRIIASGDVTCPNVTKFLGEQKRKSEEKRTNLEKLLTDSRKDQRNGNKDDDESQASPSQSKAAMQSSESSPPLFDSVFKLPGRPAPKASKQTQQLITQSDQKFISCVPSPSGREKESHTMASSSNSEKDVLSHQLLSESVSLELSSRDESKLVSLLPETTAVSFLQESVHTQDIVASTPVSGQKKGAAFFSGATPLDHHSILHLVTPYKQLKVISVPERVEIPEVCCVMLGQQTQFPVTNKHRRGVKCTFTVRKSTVDGKPISPEISPFEIKRQITLQPKSLEHVEVLFTPKTQGHFWASMEVFAQDLTNPAEFQTLSVVLEGKAEYPRLMVSPKNDFLNFGDVIWGNCAYRSFRIQNVGRSTVPIRFSIFRTESSLCHFSFCSEQSCDVSAISLTQKPEGVSSVISMSLPGCKEGEEVQTHSIKVCCQSKDVQNAEKKYGEKSEIFQAVLHIDVDMPLDSHSHLSQMRLVVSVGMVKLHIDKARLDLCCVPGEIKQGLVKLTNSGNIPMQLSLYMEPQLPCFSLNNTTMQLGPLVNQMVEIQYRPHFSSNASDKTDLILFDQLNEYLIPVSGCTKITKTKISASATSLSFGGVGVGKEKIQKFTLVPDSDSRLKIVLKDENGVFQLFNEGIKMDHTTVINVRRNVRYTINISFHPMDVQFYLQHLIVQVANADRFTIPLFGYGGHSDVEVSGVNQADNGGYLIDLCRITQGSSKVCQVLVTNHGVRTAYIKAIAYDVSRVELPPHRATIMPSRLLLEPKESKELILMLNPSEAEIKLCVSGRALVTIVKLRHGDEITRQMLLRSDTAQAHALDFDIPLTARNREIQDAEVIPSMPPGQEVSLFKKSVKTIKIGLMAQTLTPEELPKNLPSPVVTGLARPERKNQIVGNRAALKPVNQNVEVNNTRNNLWSVTPVDVHLTVFDLRSKEFAQIINFSSEEFSFSIECDDLLKAVPPKGVVKSQSFTQFAIHPNNNFWAREDKSSSCGLVKVYCAEETQYIRVQMITVHDMAPSPTLSPTLPSHNPVDSPTLQQSRSYSLPSRDVKASEMVSLSAGSEVNVPSVAPGNISETSYVFKNTGYSVLSWSVKSCNLTNLKVSGKGNVQNLPHSVFILSPTAGDLKPGESQTLRIDFSPQSSGLYSQEWLICSTSGQREHHFTIYAKGTKQTDCEHSSPRTVIQEKPQKDTKQLPAWVPVASSEEEKSPEKPAHALSHKKATTGRKREEVEQNEISLNKTYFNFGQVRKGERQILELHALNPNDNDAEMIVTQEPGVPFTTKRSHFKIGKNRMIIFPIAFKPVEIGKYTARIVMREKLSSRALTATLEGECVA